MNHIWITSEVLAAIKNRTGDRIHLSLDLGRTDENVVASSEGLRCRGAVIQWELLAKLIHSQRRNQIYMLDLSSMRGFIVACTHLGRYYSLVATSSAPTIMISGVQMHRRDDPWHDAESKVRLVVHPGDWVMDTCGGLGYTALCARERGAGLVITTEPDEAVRCLRRNNPWSSSMNKAGILSLTYTAQDLVHHARSGAMDVIIHDPPRFSLAGELYGQAFYDELRRILRRGGMLYHYTGVPYEKRRGSSFTRGVASRLSRAGFDARWHDGTKGFVGKAR